MCMPFPKDRSQYSSVNRNFLLWLWILISIDFLSTYIHIFSAAGQQLIDFFH